MKQSSRQITVLGIGAIVTVLALGAPALGQVAPIPYYEQPFAMTSGVQANVTDAPAIAFTQTVQAPPGTPWMRVRFSNFSLGPGSAIVVTSVLDGATQRLDARALQVWRNKTAYFNGSALQIDLVVGPGDQTAFFDIDQLTIGQTMTEARAQAAAAGQQGAPPDESQCGAFDDRVSSNDPAVGRIMPIGCTGWIVANGANLTAGHCISAATDTLQFNVPSSLADGTTVNPPPQHQYPIEPTGNIDFFNDGAGFIGNDWAVFETFANTTTGQHAVHVQGAFYRMSRDFTATNVRVTGYGVDNVPVGSTGNRNADNQTQQTHSGAYLGETVQGASDVFIEYTVDTEGGNSGSPVIRTDASSFPPLTLGIHTNAGCNPPSSGNTGTGFEHNNLETAIQNFLGSNTIYVDEDHLDNVAEDGTVFRPFDTFAQGVTAAAAAAGTPLLAVVEGTYTPTAPLIITDPMVIVAPVGSVVVAPP